MRIPTLVTALLLLSACPASNDSKDAGEVDTDTIDTGSPDPDADGDGTPDHEQILAGFMNDSDGNWIPDCCEAEVPCNDCEGDVVPDGIVDVQDINAILDNWGSTDVALDADGSGSVEVNDILLVLHRWGLCTEP